MYKVLICGDRHWDNVRSINREIKKLITRHGKNKLLIIHGGAKGADLLAGAIAKTLGVHSVRVDALWDYYHRSAGPVRNRVMLTLEPNEVIAFHANIDKSKGTKDMLEISENAGIKTKLVEE